MRLTQGLLRTRPEGEEHPSEVKSVELFFDLVFVFAVTQLSHLLLAHLTPSGMAETTLLLVAVWWGWIYTSWATNWLDPDHFAVRLLLFTLMLAGLVLSASIPKAFGDRGLVFALAYGAMHVVRCQFMLRALKGVNEANYRNFQRITVWLTVSTAVWIGGAFLAPGPRFWVWCLAMAIELCGPAAGFYTPGLGRSRSTDWDVSGDHLAERCGLFIIIALGESILVTGATWAELDWDHENTAALLSAAISSIAMWWIYFHIGAERARGLIAHSEDPGRIARLAYTYIHVLLVAGIIVAAVGDELAIKHPHGAAAPLTAAVLVAAPAMFLGGNLLFKWATAGWPPLSHMAGLAALAVLTFALRGQSALVLSCATTAVLVMVAAWEAVSLGGGKEGPSAV